MREILLAPIVCIAARTFPDNTHFSFKTDGEYVAKLHFSNATWAHERGIHDAIFAFSPGNLKFRAKSLFGRDFVTTEIPRAHRRQFSDLLKNSKNFSLQIGSQSVTLNELETIAAISNEGTAGRMAFADCFLVAAHSVRVFIQRLGETQDRRQL